jgi:3-hydroxyacyl-CoA dehydrogenase/enoyl-CoA hydratase/3-hydroxybutyryl-CoA epimerase
VQKEVGKAARDVGGDEIADRLVLRMVAEAFCVVQEQIAQRQSDIDVAMVLGTGFPGFRGGVLKYTYDTGLETVVSRLDLLAERFGEQFRPSEFLRNETGV